MRRRYLSAIVIIALIVLGVYYAFFVIDSPFNFYKKIKIENYAEDYMEQNYPDLKLKRVSVSYDSALKQYVADCVSKDMTVSLNYSGSFLMEYDNYYNEKYTAKAVSYQEKTKVALADALSSDEIPFSTVTVFVHLTESQKKSIVFDDAEIKNGKIDCIVTLKRENSEKVMTKYELAEYSKTVADCIYSSVGDSADVAGLTIKYDYDKYGLAELSWSKRMESMSLYEISNEIKY